MTTYYTATFPNGTVLKRATASRKYTHAWFARGTRPPGDWVDRYGATWSVSGFSGSEALAWGALASWLGHSYYGQAGYTTDFSGIAPTVEVDRKPYKATGEHAGQVTRPVKVMRAGRRSKTVAFVAIFALLTFGGLVLGANVGQNVNDLAVVYAQGKYSRKATAAVIAHQTAGGKADKWTGTPRTATAAVVGHQTADGKADKWTGTPRTGAVANLTIAARKEGEPAVSYAYWADWPVSAVRAWAGKGIEPAPSLAHEAFRVAQWASQSSHRAANEMGTPS
jgi:hypothetical protein